MMARNLTFVDTITLTVLQGGEILAGITVRVKYPLGAGAPRGGGPVQRPGGGLGMVGQDLHDRPQSRTSARSQASKHGVVCGAPCQRRSGFAGISPPLKAPSSEQLLNMVGIIPLYCCITCVK